MAAKVEIYSSQFCGYCMRAKRLLSQKGVEFVDYDVYENPGKREEMILRAGGRTTVPQIFVDGKHIGDCDEVHALDRAGRLDPLLGLAT